MICFEISINEKPICIAGIESKFGILTSILTWVRRDLAKFPADIRDNISEEELNFEVSGLINFGKNDSEELAWVRESLSPGDEIKIKIVESSHIDEPSSRKRPDPDLVEKEKRRYFESLKRDFEKE
jgi:hypothetical protein